MIDYFTKNLKEVNDLIDNDLDHQKYIAKLGKCELCKNKATDELEFETGNNAEYAVSVAFCDDHLKEAEDTGYDFEEKYAEQILECLYENWRGIADNRD